MPKTKNELAADPADSKVDDTVLSKGVEADEVPIEGTIGMDGFLQSSDTPVASPDEKVDDKVADHVDDKSVLDLADEKQQVEKKDGAGPIKPVDKKVDAGEVDDTVVTSSEEQMVGSDGVKRPRHAHYQREMQLAQNANAVLLDERKGLESAKLIADAVINNPSLASQVQAQLKGQPIDSGAEQQGALSEKPKPPEMPVGYTLMDAQNDPESASATYFNEVMKYPVKIEAWREEKEIHDNAVMRAESQQQEFNRVQANIKQGLLNEIRVNPATKDLNHAETLNKVEEFYANKEALTPQVLVNTFLSANKVEQKNVSQETDAQRRARELKERAGKVVAPVPAAVVTDDTVETVPNAISDYAKHVSDNILAKPEY